MPLIECVPNFSEGRRLDVIAALRDALSGPGVHLLDDSADPDHNRSVFTLAGEPEAVLDAAFRGVEAAVHLIDLESHSGVHPRIGAADVVPFIPLRGISLMDCAALAHQFGQRVSESLKLPVYFYEAAALRPERTNLAYLRRDPYEVLKTSIQQDPDRQPDLGPGILPSAGAVAVGARGPLIAFNAYLNTDDLRIAQNIAREIRDSGGGLPQLKALGLMVAEQAQVSMNVIDYRQTGLFAVMEALRNAADAHQVRVTHTELIGLVPQNALLDAALSYLQLPASARNQVLERNLGHHSGDYRPVPYE